MAVGVGRRTLERVKRILTVALFVVATLPAAPSHAANENTGETMDCATAHEFNSVRYDDTRRHVQEMLDGPGHHASVVVNREVIQREWRLCGKRWDQGRLIVRYSRAADRVRAALWVEGGTVFR